MLFISPYTPTTEVAFVIYAMPMMVYVNNSGFILSSRFSFVAIYFMGLQLKTEVHSPGEKYTAQLQCIIHFFCEPYLYHLTLRNS